MHGLVDVAGQAYVVEELLPEVVHPDTVSVVSVQLPAIEIPGLLDLLQLIIEAKRSRGRIFVNSFMLV
jgi:hypothetical protein